MARGRSGKARWLRAIPCYCGWRRALPERVAVRRLPAGVEDEFRVGLDPWGVYVRGYCAAAGAADRLVGLVWSTGGRWGRWSGRALARPLDRGGGRHKREVVWAVLRAAAISDHEIVFNGKYSEAAGHRSIGPRYFTACVACMLREAGYAPAPRPDYHRRRLAPDPKFMFI